MLDMSEVFWKAYIDFEMFEGECECMCVFYECFFECMKYVKVWMFYVCFEVILIVVVDDDVDDVAIVVVIVAAENDEYECFEMC